MKIIFPRLLALVSLSVSFLGAQTVDDTQLKQVIIFGRHSVRAATSSNTYLDQYSAQKFPNFGVAAGILTPNGEKLETILGGYYRQWLIQEGLLTGNDTADANFIFFHANVIQRTVDTAQHLWMGMLPGAPVNVQYLSPTTADPLFGPVAAGVAQLNSQMAIDSVNGRLGANPQSLASAYAPETALSRSVLLGYPLSETPPPLSPTSVIDATDFATNPIVVTPGTAIDAPINLGGLSTLENVVEPFVMEYADGLPVGWGQLNVGGVSQTLRILTLVLDLEYRTPYLARVESSNVASHIVRTMVQSATGNAMTGTLGTPSTKIVALIASDDNVCGLAGLFHIDWLLPGYQPDYCAPGGALVFQLRQSQSTGEYIVRASYIAQTLDQLLNQTVLTLNAPPAVAPVFIPGCSGGNATLGSTFACPLGKFVQISSQVIDPHSADLVN